jgi:hypothetical protein
LFGRAVEPTNHLSGGTDMRRLRATRFWGSLHHDSPCAARFGPAGPATSNHGRCALRSCRPGNLQPWALRAPVLRPVTITPRTFRRLRFARDRARPSVVGPARDAAHGEKVVASPGPSLASSTRRVPHGPGPVNRGPLRLLGILRIVWPQLTGPGPHGMTSIADASEGPGAENRPGVSAAPSVRRGVWSGPARIPADGVPKVASLSRVRFPLSGRYPYGV